MQPNKISVKLNVGDELRRFYFEGTAFSELCESCLQYLPEDKAGLSTQLQYQDDENEWVTFSSDAELQYAIGLVNDSPQKLLRLKMNISHPPVQFNPAPMQFNPMAGHFNPASAPFDSASVPAPFNSQEKGEEEEEDSLEDSLSLEKSRSGGRMRRGRGGGRLRDSGKKKLLDARFIQHTAVPDNTTLSPDTIFEKSWCIFNSGQISWPVGSSVVCVDKQNVFSAVSTLLPSDTVVPDTQANVTIILRTPTVPGLHQSYFKLITPEGKKFGQRLRCQIFVSGVPVQIQSLQDDTA
eukprot:TRINITY_DN16863_c0_g1_i1.p1 TRINITY_DN16863_c0_g1~~TRINITY_DN16863_c0_g1_i1.p1  ORF type:complete len:295 (+),score=63.00 TRINITY_DN16863_c0_g1_i1:46-930(+)